MCVRWQIGFALEYEDVLINDVLCVKMQIDIDTAIGDSSGIKARLDRAAISGWTVPSVLCKEQQG